MRKGCLKPTELEEKALELILEGDHPLFIALRSQLKSTNIISREMTGVGFFTKYEVEDKSTKIDLKVYKSHFSIGSIGAIISENKVEVGFLLWIIDGFIDSLEGYIYSGSWPEDEGIKKFYYCNEKNKFSGIENFALIKSA